ncbi:MAG: T9SS type A sorting domain-containing protein [Flavobacteriaceae bacterium]|jgi:hypothetical protein|nr:T9SS type A sorting domain-containing protein [Flavobacteriaceae bacterium]
MRFQIRYFLFLLIFTAIGYSQNNSQWRGYFSYNNISGITVGQNKVFAAADNAYFSKNLVNNDLKTTNTVDGLSGMTITAIYHSKNFNKTFLGYENGLIISVNESDKDIIRYVDVINKGGIPPNRKRINHFYEHENKLYISAEFGITVFNLQSGLFGDTFFIGSGGQQINVYNTTVLENQIYAVTENNGIRTADLTNPNLIDFNLWSVFDAGMWKKAVTFRNQLIFLNIFGGVYRHNNVSFIQIYNLNTASNDLFSDENHFAVCSSDRTVVFSENLAVDTQITLNQLPENTGNMTSVAVLENKIFIGTTEGGIIEIGIGNIANMEQLLPDGPSKNKIFAIKVAPSGNTIWAVYGDHSASYNPFPLDSYGISKFSETGWLNLPYSVVGQAQSIVRIAYHPNNENQVYFASFYSGILEFQNDELVALYDSSNTALQQDPTNPFVGHRINGLVFDNQNNLWSTSSLLTNGLNVKRTNNQWQVYSFENILSAPSSNSFGRMVIDKNNTKWFVSNREGVIAFNENSNPQFKKVVNEDNNNYPYTDTRAIAIDNRNQVWIGSVGGLRVLSSADRFLNSDDLVARSVIIMEDGLAQELLYNQYITNIVVDGANNKWIGTADAGVYLLSPNGQETLYRFTETNSPLPSNGIQDIDINNTTGEVFFVTDRGTVSFKGTATGSSDNLDNVIVYPNPVRPEFVGTVKISGLVDKCNIKITDIEGNLVFEKIAEGGTIEWDTTAFGKYRVASGVYMIFISTDDGMETKVKKVMIVR